MVLLTSIFLLVVATDKPGKLKVDEYGITNPFSVFR